MESIMYERGRTNTQSAIREARTTMFTQQHGSRDSADHFMVVITDGASNVNHDLTIAEAVQAQRDGIRVLVVSIGRRPSTSLELRGIASEPDELNIFAVENRRELPNLVENLVFAMCNGRIVNILFCVTSQQNQL